MKELQKYNIRLNKQQWRDLYCIYAADLTSIPFTDDSVLSIDLERLEVPNDNLNYSNPKDLLGYICMLSSQGISISAKKKEIFLF